MRWHLRYYINISHPTFIRFDYPLRVQRLLFGNKERRTSSDGEVYPRWRLKMRIPSIANHLRLTVSGEELRFAALLTEKLQKLFLLRPKSMI